MEDEEKEKIEEEEVEEEQPEQEEKEEPKSGYTDPMLADSKTKEAELIGKVKALL